MNAASPNSPSIESCQNFYDRDFFITPDVLTPRPETEQLIDEVLSLCGVPYLPGVKPNTPQIDKRNLTILDVGTGSGCIAITLKRLLPEVHVYATDISPAALKVAQKNASNQNTDITFIISYLLEKVKDNTLPKPNLIVANLPYVDPEWRWLDRESLKSDPDLALYADDHGLALIKQLLDEAAVLKIPYLVLEADPCEHDEIIKCANALNYAHLRTIGFCLAFIYKK